MKTNLTEALKKVEDIKQYHLFRKILLHLQNLGNRNYELDSQSSFDLCKVQTNSFMSNVPMPDTNWSLVTTLRRQIKWWRWQNTFYKIWRHPVSDPLEAVQEAPGWDTELRHRLPLTAHRNIHHEGEQTFHHDIPHPLRLLAQPLRHVPQLRVGQTLHLHPELVQTLSAQNSFYIRPGWGPRTFFRHTAINSPHCQEFMVWRICSVVTILLSRFMVEVTL